jgi:hypothetical protein
MKIKPEHYKQLETAINSSPFYGDLMDYLRGGNTAKTWRWDCLWTARDTTQELMAEIYQYANDDHIDTALRRITNTK